MHLKNLAFILAIFAPAAAVIAQTPEVTTITTSNNTMNFKVAPYFAADGIRMLTRTNLSQQWSTSGIAFTGYDWSTNSLTTTSRFHKVEITPHTKNRQWAGAVLNRISYGGRPDEVFALLGTNANPALYYLPGTNNDTFISNQVAAYVAGQLNPASIADDATNRHTNLVNLITRQGGVADFIRTNETSGPGTANLGELRAWYVLNAVHSRRQLLEQLNQFIENFFVTQFDKSRDFFAGPYNGVPNVADRHATRLEWLETSLYRQALLNPAVTFSNLLLIQAESPAMIIFLDTQTSRSDGANVANENYAREIMELFSLGVDNGYDQRDITEMAPCWTGWIVRWVSLANASNVFAAQHTTPQSNNVGTWRFCFNAAVHGTAATYNTNYIFFNRNSNDVITGPKSVPARFGAPWTQNVYPGTGSLGPLAGGGANGAGQYGLFIPPQGALNNTNNIQDGYIIVKHLADLPFTQEFLVSKLCRWFVHDNFPFGPVNGYDFSTNHADVTRPWYNDSDEGRLMRQCMLAWETNTPKGQIYKVLQTIFNSDVFKTNAYANKIKTPLEFTVSAIRAIQVSSNGSQLAGTWTGDTDGYSVAGSAGGVAVPLMRMGNMSIFDRDAPDGFPEYGQAWLSAGTLAERVRYVQALLMPSGTLNGFNYAVSIAKYDGYSTGNPLGGTINRNVSDAIGLIDARLNTTDRENPAAIAEYLVNIIYPGEGRANLDLYRIAARDFLNQDKDGAVSSLFGLRGTNFAEYEERIRGCVSMLLSMQRFNEQ